MNEEERAMYGFACSLVHFTGLKLKGERQHSAPVAKEKTSHMDLVTEQDLAIEKLLVEAVSNKYPGHGILSEESKAWADGDGADSRRQKSDSWEIGAYQKEYRWVIDPIDGTLNFYRSGRDYAISLAVYKGETPVFGLVYDVAGDVIFSAGQGEGAMINGCLLPVLPERSQRLEKAVVGMSLRTMREFTAMGMDVLDLLSRAQAYRYLGCASLELCRVATGDYDLFISSTVYEWDVAAARVFLEQRGGFFLCQRQGDHNSSASKLWVAGFRSPALWQEALEHLPPCVRKQFAIV